VPAACVEENVRFRRTSACRTGFRHRERDDTGVVVDANVTSDLPTPQTSDEQTNAVPTAESDAESSSAETGAAPSSQSQQRVRSVPKHLVTREQADEVGRIAVRAGTGAARLIVDFARYASGVVAQLVRAIGAIPPVLRLLILVGVLTLLAIVGSITLHNALGVACIVIVVPVCSIILGAVGHRWYSELVRQQTPRGVGHAADIPASELQRSVEYVDKKLTVALNSFSAERHQHAMIALFQAKTAIELTLGTEQDVSPIDALLATEDYYARPRIRPGSASKSALRESNSLAAS